MVDAARDEASLDVLRCGWSLFKGDPRGIRRARDKGRLRTAQSAQAAPDRLLQELAPAPGGASV